MSGPIYGQNFSVRVADDLGRRFDALAHSCGLRRSELLRLLVRKLVDGDIADALPTSGADVRRARAVAP